MASATPYSSFVHPARDADGSGGARATAFGRVDSMVRPGRGIGTSMIGAASLPEELHDNEIGERPKRTGYCRGPFFFYPDGGVRGLHEAGRRTLGLRLPDDVPNGQIIGPLMLRSLSAAALRLDRP